MREQVVSNTPYSDNLCVPVERWSSDAKNQTRRHMTVFNVKFPHVPKREEGSDFVMDIRSSSSTAGRPGSAAFRI